MNARVGGEPVTVAGSAAALSSTRCVVTGGLGFIGSNLVHALSAAGARIGIIDELVEDHGGSTRNVEGVDVDVLVASIADPRAASFIEGADVIFNIAGQVSHIASMRDPQQDLRLNATTHGIFLDMVRASNPMARIVHTSTRQVYGRAIRLPVDETHPTNPVDVNGVAKLAGEHLHMVYAHAYDMAVTSLRLTNVFGPRQRLTSDELGFLPVFIRRGLEGSEIEIYGDGSQRRDCLYVDDVVDALVTTASAGDAIGHVYNVGNVEDHALVEIAQMVVEATGGPSEIRLRPWPTEHVRLDIGSIQVDGSKAERELGWHAKIAMRDGVQRTIDFYREQPWYLSST